MLDATPALGSKDLGAEGCRDFAEFLDEHKDRLVAYLLRLTGDRARAEELGQESFARIYFTSRGGGFSVPMLYRVAVNLARSDQRRARRWHWVERLLSAGGPAAPSPHAHAERSQARSQLERTLASVDLRYRVPLLLRDVEDWSYEEIAQAVGCPEGTVKSRISRGREQLRALMGPAWSQGGES